MKVSKSQTRKMISEAIGKLLKESSSSSIVDRYLYGEIDPTNVIQGKKTYAILEMEQGFGGYRVVESDSLEGVIEELARQIRLGNVEEIRAIFHADIIGGEL